MAKTHGHNYEGETEDMESYEQALADLGVECPGCGKVYADAERPAFVDVFEPLFCGACMAEAEALPDYERPTAEETRAKLEGYGVLSPDELWEKLARQQKERRYAEMGDDY